MIGQRPVVLHVRAESNPCVDCGKPIAPGQLYVIGGPLHIACDPRREAMQERAARSVLYGKRSGTVEPHA